MDDLKIEAEAFKKWTTRTDEVAYTKVMLSGLNFEDWERLMCVHVRRCYISDDLLEMRSREVSRPKSEILTSKLPDVPSTMSGDFGEILVYIVHHHFEHPKCIFGPKKWRLKQDKGKPAPYSDVVHFSLPSWHVPSINDEVICSEVKTKATAAKSDPINSAIRDCEKDRISRLGNTLVWLKDRALGESLGDVKIQHLERFINSIEYPKAKKRFQAVAVISSEFLESELEAAPKTPSTDYKVIIIGVENLKEVYTRVYNGVQDTPDRSKQTGSTQ